MRRSSRPLPTVSSELPLGVILAVGLVAGAVSVVVPISWLVLAPPGLRAGWLLMMLALGSWTLVNVAVSLLERYLKQRGRRRWQHRAFALGLLDYRERVRAADLDGFRALPLFRFGDPTKECACCLASGVLDARAVTVLQYRYAAWIPAAEPHCGHAQTVAVFPDVELPDFHLAAEENIWNAILHDWPPRLGLGRVVRVINGYSADPIHIRSEDEQGVARLFTSERIERLGELEGWVLECKGGCLAVYRHKKVMDEEMLPAFVHRAVDLVAVLTAKEEPAPAGDPVSEHVRIAPLDRIQASDAP
jgi:hypothetical protein